MIFPMKIATVSLCVGRGTIGVAGPVDLALSSGEGLVVTGPNGAGKSTLLRTLAGLLPPLSGSIVVSDVIAPDGEPARSIAEIAHYVGHRNAMKPGIGVGDNLGFWRDYMGAAVATGGAMSPHSSSTQALSNVAALDAVGLPDLTHLPFGYLSAGQQRRASLARLLVAPRPVWLLDEPTAALDAASQARFGLMMTAHLDAGGVVIAATHQPLGLERAGRLELQPTGGLTVGRSAGADESYEPAGISEADFENAEGWL